MRTVCRLPGTTNREMLLEGRQTLLQGRLLQVGKREFSLVLIYQLKTSRILETISRSLGMIIKSFLMIGLPAVGV